METVIRTAAQVAAMLDPLPVTTEDRVYAFGTPEWFHGKHVPWWKTHVAEAGMVFVPEGRDCNRWVGAFLTGLDDAARDSRAGAGFAAARLRVRNLVPVLGIKAGPHVTVLIGLSVRGQIGWVVFEPITNQYVDYAKYTGSHKLGAAF